MSAACAIMSIASYWAVSPARTSMLQIGKPVSVFQRTLQSRLHLGATSATLLLGFATAAATLSDPDTPGQTASQVRKVSGSGLPCGGAPARRGLAWLSCSEPDNRLAGEMGSHGDRVSWEFAVWSRISRSSKFAGASRSRPGRTATHSTPCAGFSIPNTTASCRGDQRAPFHRRPSRHA